MISKDELKTLLEKYSMNEIRKFKNCSLNQIIYWAKKYRLKSRFASFENKITNKIFKRNHSMSKDQIKEARIKRINLFPIKEINEKFQNGRTWKEIHKEYHLPFYLIEFGFKENVFAQIPKGIKRKKYIHPFHFTQEQKDKISQKRKEYLKNHPECHPWKNKKKFISVPCENLKKWLRENNILFAEEYEPFIDLNRFYSIDIAFPDKKIAVEINGNQHYMRDGSLKPYYAKRHKFFEDNGWIIYEIIYSFCFKEDKIKEFFDKILSSEMKENFDYINYKQRKDLDKNEIIELLEIFSIKQVAERKKVGCYYLKKFCKENGIQNPKGKRKGMAVKGKYPQDSVLCKLVWEKPVLQIAREIGVSDCAIIKYCRGKNIPVPPRGYWRKLSTGKTEECESIKRKLLNNNDL